MRLAFIAAAGAREIADPLLGERDASLFSARLRMKDLGFEIVMVDPSEDLAAQLDELLTRTDGRLDDLLVYASCVLAVAGKECFLCLDPSDLDVGDALADVIGVLKGRASRATLLFAELRHDDDGADRAALRDALDAVQRAVDSQATGIELVAELRPMGAHNERVPSRLTAGLLEAIDSKPGALTARQAYATAIQRTDFGHWPNVIGHCKAPKPFQLRLRGQDLTATLSSVGVPPVPETPAAATTRPFATTMPSVGIGQVQPAEGLSPSTAEAPDTEVMAKPPSFVDESPPAVEQRPSSTRAARRPAPASERVESASSAVPVRKKPSDPSSIPKVVIGTAQARTASHEAVSSPAEPSSEPETIADEISITEEISVHDVDEDLSAANAPPTPTARKRAADMTVDDHVEAGDLARSLNRVDEAVSHYKKGLAKLGTAATPERAGIYVRIADVARSRGKTRVAISNYDKALSITPTDRHALAGIIDLNVEQKNWRAVHSAEQKFLAGLDDGETKLAELLASGDRWLEQAEDHRRAKERYTDARDAFEDAVEPLQRLLAMYEKEGATERAVQMQRLIAERLTDPRSRARAFFAIGEICLFELKDERGGYEAFELALEHDPTMLEALEVLATALADDQEWGELERIYQKMIAKFHALTSDKQTRTVLCELYRRSALLCRDHLDDPGSALNAVESELAIRPRSLSAQILACELAVELEDGSRALEHLRAAAVLEPGRSETYHQLFALGQRFDAPEVAFMAASVATVLGVSDDRERLIYREHRVQGVAPHCRPMSPRGWAWLRQERDTSVEEVMGAIAPAVLRTRVKQLDKAGELPVLLQEARQDPDTSTVSAVKSLQWASHFLGAPIPDIYLDEELDGHYVATFAKRQSTIIGKDALRGRTLGELAFLVGRHLTLRIPEHELVAHLSSSDELTVTFLAALHIVLGTAPTSSKSSVKAVETLAKILAKNQTPDERKALVVAVNRFNDAGGRVSINRWLRAVDLCATRAGFVLCGDLETAVDIIRREGDSPFTSVERRLDDLCTFAVSADCARARQELGSSLEDDDEQPALSAL